MIQRFAKLVKLVLSERTKAITRMIPTRSVGISGRRQARCLRHINTSLIRPNLFGGGKQLNNSRPDPPSEKSQTVSNPADLFKKNDILIHSSKPVNYIESVKKDGFHLANQLFIQSPNEKGEIIGALLLETESFEINLSNNGFTITNNILVEFHDDLFKLLSKIHPKPEILVVGLGKRARMLSEKNRKQFVALGIQLEIGDSLHSAKIFDLLATERPNTIGALLLPPNV